MSIQVKQNADGICALLIAEKMTIHTAASHKEALLGYLEQCTELQIDLSQVSDMDSAGLQVLLLTKREANQSNKRVRLVAHSPATQAVFELLNIAFHFDDIPVLCPRDDTNSQENGT